MNEEQIERNEANRLKRNAYMRQYYNKKKHTKKQLTERFDQLLDKLNDNKIIIDKEQIAEKEAIIQKQQIEIDNLQNLVNKLKVYIQDHV